MRRRYWLLTLGLFLGVAGATAAVLGTLARSTPDFYAGAEVPAGTERAALSRGFQTEFFDLLNSIANDDSAWSAEFPAASLNAYFQEDFIKSGGVQSLTEAGLSDLRVVIDDDRVRVAARYGEGFWSTVLTLEVRFRLAAKEPNVVLLELLGLKAGRLPVPSRWLLEPIAEMARQLNIDVQWYRHDGHPVALMRFQADRVRPTYQLLRLGVRDGAFQVVGRSLTGAAGAE